MSPGGDLLVNDVQHRASLRHYLQATYLKRARYQTSTSLRTRLRATWRAQLANHLRAGHLPSRPTIHPHHATCLNFCR